MITPPEYYSGKCPVGGEEIVLKDKVSFDTALVPEPYVECPAHGVRVPVGVISKEEHDEVWSKFGS